MFWVLSIFVFSRFPSHPRSTFNRANFGISLCLWIEVDKGALIALPCTLRFVPLVFSTPIASSSFFLSIFHLGMGWGPLVINKTGRDGESVCVGGGCLSGTVKRNPKSTASSSTTILMEIGNILYQGNHILLEMTVSKVGVDTMATKQLFASQASRREGRLSDREGR